MRGEYFNSIKVQLKHGFHLHSHTIYYHFNSIKVQLKLKVKFSTSLHRSQFQFHKGTIKAVITVALQKFNNISIP